VEETLDPVFVPGFVEPLEAGEELGAQEGGGMQQLVLAGDVPVGQHHRREVAVGDGMAFGDVARRARLQGLGAPPGS
jgi:hypothetical protein